MQNICHHAFANMGKHDLDSDKGRESYKCLPNARDDPYTFSANTSTLVSLCPYYSNPALLKGFRVIVAAAHFARVPAQIVW